MSSHREAPEISKDPVADNTDVYAFVSPDKPDTVTHHHQLHPAPEPARRPELLRVRRRRPLLDLHRQRRRRAARRSPTSSASRRSCANPNTFLYNTGPIASLTDPNWNKRQFYSVTRVDAAARRTARSGTPRCTHGTHGRRAASCSARTSRARRATSGRARPPTTTPLASAAVHTLPSGETVFAGQRNDGFFVDLGAIFDLGDLRPFQNLHLIPTRRRPASITLATLNIHTIAIQVPISQLT